MDADTRLILLVVTVAGAAAVMAGIVASALLNLRLVRLMRIARKSARRAELSAWRAVAAARKAADEARAAAAPPPFLSS